MVDKLTSRKLIAFGLGLGFQAGLLVLAAYKTVEAASVEKAQWMGFALTVAAIGAQGLLDFIKTKNGLGRG